MERLLALGERPTAIFAGNDQMAVGAIEVLREHGCSVPGDMAIVGFDDAPVAQELLRPLTTVRIPYAELGRRAAALLLRAVQGGHDNPVTETVPLELIRRATA
jgi:DNA-binding LacI/PurR family transcriptional regulator